MTTLSEQPIVVEGTAFHPGQLGHKMAVTIAVLSERLRQVGALVPAFEAKYGLDSSPVSLLRAALAADPHTPGQDGA